MPQFEHLETFSRPIEEVFDFFVHPSNLSLVSPPELHLSVSEAPQRLQNGSRIVVNGRRWGIPHTIVSEVIGFEEKTFFVDRQIKGPFNKFVHMHCFESLPDGTRILDSIDFEPPGGMLGLVVTASFIQKDLEWAFAYRTQKLRELLGPYPARAAR